MTVRRLLTLAVPIVFAAALLACSGGSSTPVDPPSQPTSDLPGGPLVSGTPRVYFIHTEW